MTPAATPAAGRLAPVRFESLPPYAPTTYLDFSQPAERAAFEKALAEVKAQFGKTYPLVINGERVDGGEKPFTTTNPARPGEVLGTFQSGSRAQAELAVEAAANAFASWSRVPAAERAAYLVEAAKRMRERRNTFSAWMVFEVGKSWAEADADTGEAIDFMEFYAREMLRYDQPVPLTQLPGETDTQVYLPLGVGAVIPPWNFPLAI
ncbi:MAG: aldehyde dehydrogenase family protein, partial [Candidatus Eisenbacteria bacterium]